MIKHAIVCFILALLLPFTLGCGEEGLIEPHGEVDIPPPPSEGLHAVAFPTNNGSAWTYENVGTGQEFTLRIEDTRDVEGFTHRQITVSEITVPDDSDSTSREVVDHLPANALYYFESRIQITQPVFATYFLKTPQAYIESAFDIFLGARVIHLKHFSSYRLWDFPLKKGKEWTVFEKTTLPTARVIRRVLDENVPVSVPDGNYDAYLVEEEIEGLSQEEAIKQSTVDPSQIESARYEPAKYWVVPNVGVVKYQYDQLVPVLLGQQRTNLIRSFTFELKEKELPGANPR